MEDWLQKEHDAWSGFANDSQHQFIEGYTCTQTMDEIIQEMRGEFDQTITVIYKNAVVAPDSISYDLAEQSMILVGHEYRHIWLDAYQDKLDPYARFWITVEVYDSAPYQSIPKRTIMGLKKIRPDDYLKDLAPDFLDVDPITIYRGGNETEREANNSFSWTTDPVTAIWFYNRKRETYEYNHKGERPEVWTGQIFKKDIIATNNQRSEYEVIQHGSIKNLCKVDLTDAEIKSALDVEAKRREAEWPKLSKEDGKNVSEECG